MATMIENWDDDADFQGDLFATSVSTVQTGFSSRLSASVRSESNAGDEDWQVLLTTNDETSTQSAIASAKQAGIPIPASVPSSALFGGPITRLGNKKSRQNIADDWGDDLDLPGPISGGLKLKFGLPEDKAVRPATPAQDDDDFDDWAEGSLGIRFAGTKREAKNLSSSVSAMSPSLGSCMTVESEDDGLDGLVLPLEPLDFNARLKKRMDFEEDIATSPPAPAPIPAPIASTPSPRPVLPQTPAMENDDFFADLDFGAGEVLDTKKLTLNRNIKIQTAKSQPSAPRVATTLTFSDKPLVSRIPRPATTSRSRLDPVYEAGAAQVTRLGRPAPTTTNEQLLRSKRSAPAGNLRNQFNAGPKPPVPFLPAGVSNARSHHITAKPVPHHVRRESDPNRAKSPPPRPFSRLSAIHAVPDTPSRPARRGVAPAALAREAAVKSIHLPVPVRPRNFGNGTELEIFDDLPTSASKESKFVKVPVARGPPKVLRQPLQSQSRLPLRDRMTTPLPPATPLPPPTPSRGVPKPQENLPRFARDTQASRIAREQRLGGGATPSRPRGEGPLMPITTNWKAQVAARSPHLQSPTAQRGKKKGEGKQPFLIKQLSAPTQVKNEKGMVYNPQAQRWEGNENALASFTSPSTTTLQFPVPPTTNMPHHVLHNPLPPSPPRPALITHIAPTKGVRVEKGMVFDPHSMRWLKLDHRSTDPLSPSASVGEDDEDPFAGFDDLVDEPTKGEVSLAGAGTGAPAEVLAEHVPEEFDPGPEFIRRIREEEAVWRRKTEAWVGSQRVALGEGWKWAIRRYAGTMEEERGRWDD